MMVDAHEIKPGSLVLVRNLETDDEEATDNSIRDFADGLAAAIGHKDFLIMWLDPEHSVEVSPAKSLIRKLDARFRWMDWEEFVVTLTPAEIELLEACRG